MSSALSNFSHVSSKYCRGSTCVAGLRFLTTSLLAPRCGLNALRVDAVGLAAVLGRRGDDVGEDVRSMTPFLPFGDRLEGKLYILPTESGLCLGGRGLVAGGGGVEGRPSSLLRFRSGDEGIEGLGCVVVKSSEMLCWCCFGSCCCLLRCSDKSSDDLRFLVSVDSLMSLRWAGGGIDEGERPRVPVVEADVPVV